MVVETKVSSGHQTVIPSKVRKEYKIEPGDIIEWIDLKNGVLIRARKKRTLKDIVGLVKVGGDAIESKKGIQKGGLK